MIWEWVFILVKKASIFFGSLTNTWSINLIKFLSNTFLKNSNLILKVWLSLGLWMGKASNEANYKMHIRFFTIWNNNWRFLLPFGLLQ